MERKWYFEALYRKELLHMGVYGRLMEHEGNPTLKGILGRLSRLESRHASLWHSLVGRTAVEPRSIAEVARVALYRAFRLVFGLSMTIKLIEYKEAQLYRKLDAAIVRSGCTPRERRIISRIRKSEERREDPLVNRIAEYSPILNNIRDVIFGMNDGLVEILAATVGISAALQSPLLVLAAGLIVAISGTLSMAGGAYLSTAYEKQLRAMEGKSFKTPTKSALYVGVSYIIGAIFPLLPFMVGYGGVLGIALSLAITAAVLTIVASTIAVITDVSIKRRVASTLLITFGIAALTILIGYFARVQFGISI